MSRKLELLLEAERRGILDERNKALLAEARKRGIVPGREYEWGEVPKYAISNVGESAANFARAMIEPFLDPLTTIYAIDKLKQGVASKIGDAMLAPLMDLAGLDSKNPVYKEIRSDLEREADAVGEMLKERYGSEEALKRTMAEDPVGFLADVSAVVTGAGAAVSRLPGAAGAIGRAAQKTGQALDPLNAPVQAARGASWLAGRGGRMSSGVTSGVGESPILESYRTGKEQMLGQTPVGKYQAAALREGMRGGGGGPSDLVERARAAVSELRDRRNAAYAASEAGVAMNRPVGNVQPVIDSMRRARDTVVSGGFVKDLDAVAVLDEVAGAWQELNDAAAARGTQLTAMDLNNLNQRLSAMQRNVKPNTNSDRVLTTIGKDLRREIGKIDPKFIEMNKEYARATQQINELERALSLGRRANIDTAANKLASTMRSGVNTSFAYRDEMLRGIDQIDPTLRSAIAGQALEPGAPQGLARLGMAGSLATGFFGGPAMWPGAAAWFIKSSPRITGEIAHKAGQLAGLTDRIPMIEIPGTGIRPVQPNLAGTARILGEMEQGVEENVPGYSPDTNLMQSLIPGAQAAPAPPAGDPTRVTITPDALTPEQQEMLRQWQISQGR